VPVGRGQRPKALLGTGWCCTGVVSRGQGGAKAKANQLEYKDLFVDSCTFLYVF